LILHRPPQTFDENVIPKIAPAVHADLDAVFFQGSGKSITGKLAALIGVEDLRATIAPDSFLQGRHTEVGVQGVGETPGKYLAAVPVHHRHKIHEAPPKRDIGYVGRPHLVGTVDGEITQQIGVYFMARMRLAGLGMRIDCLNAHQPHQALYPFPIEFMAQTPEMLGH